MKCSGGSNVWGSASKGIQPVHSVSPVQPAVGCDPSPLARTGILPGALGTAELSPLQVAIGYSTFANGGYKVAAYSIDRIEDASGKVLLQAHPALACAECDRAKDPPAAKGSAASAGARASQLDEAMHDGKSVIPVKNLAPQIIRPQIAYLLADMMKDVIRHGTGMRAL